MFVIIFNRDKTPDKWTTVGPFTSQTSAGHYAKEIYRKNHTAWVVVPLTDPAE